MDWNEGGAYQLLFAPMSLKHVCWLAGKVYGLVRNSTIVSHFQTHDCVQTLPPLNLEEEFDEQDISKIGFKLSATPLMKMGENSTDSKSQFTFTIFIQVRHSIKFTEIILYSTIYNGIFLWVLCLMPARSFQVVHMHINISVCMRLQLPWLELQSLRQANKEIRKHGEPWLNAMAGFTSAHQRWASTESKCPRREAAAATLSSSWQLLYSNSSQGRARRGDHLSLVLLH